MMEAPRRRLLPATRVGRTLALIIMVAGVACILGAVLDPARAASCYLAALATAVSTVVGVLLMYMAIELSGGTWFAAVRPYAERVIGALPVMGLLFLPIVIGASSLYPWAASRAGLTPDARAAIDGKGFYLTTGFALARALLYWGVWIAVGEAIRRASSRRDVDAEARRRMRVASAVGLLLVGVTSTFASIDWLMSLSPDWASSVFGLYYYAGSSVAALALLSVICGMIRRRGTNASLTPDHLHALGKLLLTFILLWAYLAYSQFLIVWLANVPTEVDWLAVRSRGFWGALGVALIVGHFAFPLLLLLVTPVKRSAPAMVSIGLWMLLMHYLDVYWLVRPAQSLRGVTPSWLDVATLVLVAALTGAAAAWRPPPTPIGPEETSRRMSLQGDVGELGSQAR